MNSNCSVWQDSWQHWISELGKLASFFSKLLQSRIVWSPNPDTADKGKIIPKLILKVIISKHLEVYQKYSTMHHISTLFPVFGNVVIQSFKFDITSTLPMFLNFSLSSAHQVSKCLQVTQYELYTKWTRLLPIQFI